MLDAFNKKNVRRLLTSRRIEHANDRNEDAVTSMVFSPLRFMNAEDALECMKLVLGEHFPRSLSQPNSRATSIELWPGQLIAQNLELCRPTRCEPDLVVKCECTDGRVVILLGEMKWDWLPPQRELAAELSRGREAVSEGNGQPEIISFAVTKKRRPEYRRLNVRTWTEIHRSLCDKGHSTLSLPVLRWAQSVAEFLQLAEQTSFSGFQKTYHLPKENGSPLFFRYVPCADISSPRPPAR